MSEPFTAGVFIIDKPAGLTSFKIVARVRWLLGIKKVGHAGTLDPFATGLLIVCAGRPATRLISRFMDGQKEYLATLCLGVETTTQDTEGEVVSRKVVGALSASRIEACLAGFRGEISQVPPSYSACKHKGKPLYYYARKGVEIVKDPRVVMIHELERIDGSLGLYGDEVSIRIRVVCSKGTYIRTLGADIGRELGCGGYLTQLRRVRSGCFGIEKGVTGEELFGENGYEKLMNSAISVETVLDMLQDSSGMNN